MKKPKAKERPNAAYLQSQFVAPPALFAAQSVYTTLPANHWRCPNCRMVNSNRTPVCLAGFCGQKQPEKP
jgi:hypothetical protein